MRRSKLFAVTSTILAGILAVLTLEAGTSAGTGAPESSVPKLTDDSFERWRGFIHPKPQELEWQKIGWRLTLWDAVREAQEKRRPVMFLAMNGHPLGVT